MRRVVWLKFSSFSKISNTKIVIGCRDRGGKHYLNDMSYDHILKFNWCFFEFLIRSAHSRSELQGDFEALGGN
jgi:hypothetical protein